MPHVLSKQALHEMIDTMLDDGLPVMEVLVTIIGILRELDGGVMVATLAESEAADACVCALAGQEPEAYKADNIYTVCADCGAAITHRPYAPKAPVKLCLGCSMARAERSRGAKPN